MRCCFRRGARFPGRLADTYGGTTLRHKTIATSMRGNEDIHPGSAPYPTLRNGDSHQTSLWPSQKFVGPRRVAWRGLVLVDSCAGRNSIKSEIKPFYFQYIWD